MSLDPISEIERRVLSSCADAPEWSQRLKPCKPVVVRLVNSGHLRRCCQNGSTVPLMVEITAKGLSRLAKLRQAAVTTPIESGKVAG